MINFIHVTYYSIAKKVYSLTTFMAGVVMVSD